jgi:hypothetical protein
VGKRTEDLESAVKPARKQTNKQTNARTCGGKEIVQDRENVTTAETSWSSMHCTLYCTCLQISIWILLQILRKFKTRYKVTKRKLIRGKK